MNDDIDMCPEGIYGLTKEVDTALDRIAATRLSKAKSKSKTKRSTPKIHIHKPRMPKSLGKIEAANVVQVSSDTLRTISTSIDRKTKLFNNLLLERLVPLLLSFDTGTSYTKAALRDGLNLEIEFDSGLEDIIKNIGYLNVVFHFVKNSALPNSVKRNFMMHMSEKLATEAVAALATSNKNQNMRKHMEELQAVVYTSQKGKQVRTSGTKDDDEDKVSPPTSARLKRRR